MRAILAALGISLALAGCAGDFAGTGDDNTGCSVSLVYSPQDPIVVGPMTEIRVDSVVTDAAGTFQYEWTVTKGGDLVPFDDAQSDHSAIQFLGDETGAYDVRLSVFPSSGESCPQGHAIVNVLANTDMHAVRLRITPPPGVEAALYDQRIQLHDAMDYDSGAVVVPAGVIAHGTVSQPAFLMFQSASYPDQVTQAFTDASGAFSVRVADGTTLVTVVPETAGYAPKRFTVMRPGDAQAFTVTAGDTITGSVKRGATAIANAKVQLMIGGVPTTLGTTDAGGNFTVLGTRAPLVDISVEVTPPAGSGLPRLALTSDTVDLGQPVTVVYGAIATRDLAGVHVRRGGTALAGKQVAIVGTTGNAATIQGETAGGVFRATATTDGTGALPALLAPAVPLHAVTTVAAGDLAVDDIDLSLALPAQIDAPAATALATRATDGTLALAGALLDLVPAGALQLAGAPTLHFTAGADGSIAGTVATGGEYDVRWTDPQRRRAPYVEHGVAQIAPAYLLPAPIFVKGELTVMMSTNPLVGASVQILCDNCTGLDRDRPIAETVSDAHGAFTLAVPDPGAM